MYVGTHNEGQETVQNNLPLSQSPVICLTYSESPGSVVPCAVPNSSFNLNCSNHCNSILMNHNPGNLSKSQTESCSSENAVASDCCKKLVVFPVSETGNAFSGCAVCGDESVSEQTSVPSSRDGTAVCLSVGSSQLTQATVDDALRIFNKYISHEATHPIRFPDVARDRVVAAICNDAGMVDAESFTELQGFVLQTMEKE
jgi:hypothetical protein